MQSASTACEDATRRNKTLFEKKTKLKKKPIVTQGTLRAVQEKPTSRKSRANYHPKNKDFAHINKLYEALHFHPVPQREKNVV